MDIIIKNFQAISSAKFRFEGFGLIVGQSSSGKSACMRAINAAAHNRFKNKQVKYGEEEAEILIRTEANEPVITAIRPRTGSIIYKRGNDKFTKVNRTIPLEIDSQLNLGVIDMDAKKHSLHFHMQFQKPLLLEYSNKKLLEILSASKAFDDLNVLKEFLTDKRSQLKGGFTAVSSIISENNVNISSTKKYLETNKPYYNLAISCKEECRIGVDLWFCSCSYCK